MATAELHDIFRAYVHLLVDPKQTQDPTELLGRLHVAVREGETARVAREGGQALEGPLRSPKVGMSDVRREAADGWAQA